MKEKILKRKLKKELKLLKEQQETKNDPSTSCMGRGIYCKSARTGRTVEATFILKTSKRVQCKCPSGFQQRFVK